MINKLIVLLEKLVGKTMFWAGIEIGRKGEPVWQIKLMTGIEREKEKQENYDE